ncbi:MAG TPA: phosphocholine cytidylyltransferase family protein [Kofleriaceae bacterium]|nr:phosphocholine cytidylyltransferase family protein [Kofleriaceae bacterium]
MKAVILAAGVGSRLGDETNDKPKPLVKIHHRSLLFRQLDSLAKAGIAPENVVVVGGYRINQIADALTSGGFHSTKLVLNERFEPPWGNFLSLLSAAPELRGHPFLQVDGDLLVDDEILPALIAARGEALLATDPHAELDGDAMKVELDANGVLVSLDKVKVDMKKVVGEFIGVTKLSAAAGEAVFAELDKFLGEGLTDQYYERAYERLSRSGAVPFGVHLLAKSAVWREIDDAVDLADARAKFF